jgi:electron transfer flavoprotein beta subunit
LQIKEKLDNGTEVVVVTIRFRKLIPLKLLKDGLAKGADRGIFIQMKISTYRSIINSKIIFREFKR